MNYLQNLLGKLGIKALDERIKIKTPKGGDGWYVKVFDHDNDPEGYHFSKDEIGDNDKILVVYPDNVTSQSTTVLQVCYFLDGMFLDVVDTVFVSKDSSVGYCVYSPQKAEELEIELPENYLFTIMIKQ